MTEGEFHYSGAEFEALSQGHNYYRWILDMFGDRVRGRVVEVGAGRGTFSSRLLGVEAVRELLLVEPDVALHEQLQRRFANEPRVTTFQGYFGDQDLGGPVDAIVLVNVLEHIEDEAALVRAACAALRPGGALLLFVPAGPALFGSLDRAFDHFRRYRRRALADLLAAGGLEPRMVHYVNAPGALAWFVAGRILGQRTIRVSQMKLYDRFVIPLIARVESRVRPPRGQSLIAVAVRPGDEP